MKFNKILALPALAFALLGMGACTDEVKYDPAQPESNAEVFFAATTPTSVALDNQQNVINIPVYRANTAGAVTVAIASTQTADGEPTNIFSVPGDITFADGSDEAVVSVSLDFGQIVANTEYDITLTIEDAAQTEYGKRTQTFTVTYAPWSDWEVLSELGTMTLAARYSGVFGAAIKERSNLLDPNEVQYMIIGEDDEKYGAKYGMFGKSFVINLNKQTNIIGIEPQDIGMPYQNTMACYITDAYTFYTKIVNNPNVNAEDYKNASKFDPETGMMTIAAVYFVYTEPGRVGSWSGTEFLQLPGYPDYNLYFANNGSKISEDGIESAIVTIAMGEDVNGFAMSMKDGYLSAASIKAAADAIMADTEATLYYNGGDYEFPMTTSGYKTLVCVTYDASGEALGTQSYTFNYEMQGIDWNEGWKSLGKVLYTDYFVYTKPATWQVEMQESESTPGMFRLVKPYATHPGVDPEDVERGHFYILINAVNPNQVYIPLSTTCLGYGVMTDAYYQLLTGATREEVTASGMWGTYKDGTITFPAEALELVAGSNIYVCNEKEVTIVEPIKKPDAPTQPELGTKPAAGTMSAKSAVAPVAKKFNTGIKAVETSRKGNGKKLGTVSRVQN